MMNLGKLSGLKGLVSHSSGKRRFKGKGDLTPDMISPPLDDFRHIMHVGRGGDVFGDTSFLSNHGGAGNNTDGDSSSTSEKNEGFFARTLRYVRRTPDRPRGGSKDLSPPPPPVSPLIKNAISLPRLDVGDSPNGCPVKELFPNSPKTPGSSAHLYSLESGFITLPRLSRTERQSQSGSPPSCPPETLRGSLTDTGVSFPCSDSVSTLNSMTSFTLDLGPSLMSEVFGVIDSPVCVKGGSFGPSFGPTDDEMDSETTLSLVDSLLREDSDGRTRLYGGEWNYLDFVNGESPKKSIVRDLRCSSSAEDHGMEAERFQRTADASARQYRGGLRITDPYSSHRRPYNCLDEEEIKV